MQEYQSVCTNKSMIVATFVIRQVIDCEQPFQFIYPKKVHQQQNSKRKALKNTNNSVVATFLI